MIRLDALTGQVHTVTDPMATWHFEVNSPKADKIYLVTAMPDGSTLWTAMHRDSGGPWLTDLDLRRGDYRFRYFIVKDESFINAGAEGLTAVPSDAAMALA